MSDQDTFRITNENDWFGELPDEVAKLFVSRASLRKLADGQLLHARGDEPEGMYRVVRGRLRFSLLSADGREMFITTYEEGNWLGEVSLLDGKTRAHDARAVGDTEVLVLSRAAFDAVLDAHPEIYPHLVRMLCRKVRAAVHAYQHVVLASFPQRLATCLVALARAHGRHTADGVVIDLHLPQEELATRVNASRQTVNRELRHLERRGWLSLRYGRITLHAPEAIREIAAGTNFG